MSDDQRKKVAEIDKRVAADPNYDGQGKTNLETRKNSRVAGTVIIGAAIVTVVIIFASLMSTFGPW